MLVYFFIYMLYGFLGICVNEWKCKFWIVFVVVIWFFGLYSGSVYVCLLIVKCCNLLYSFLCLVMFCVWVVVCS